MLFPIILVSLASTAAAVAQTPDGFQPSVETPLTVAFPRNITVSPPGVLLQKSDTQVAPTLKAPAGTPTGESYIVFMIDLDVPRNGTTTTLLHWFKRDFTLSSDLVLTPSSANASTGASYIGPSPPPGNPHRYTFLLFSQPDGFAVPESFSNINPPTATSARIGFNITRFVVAAGLDAPRAGNYFRVVNSSATASGTGSPAATSPVQHQGGSSPMKSSIGTYLGVLFLLAAMVEGLGAI